jgi:hypothetical protein
VAAIVLLSPIGPSDPVPYRVAASEANAAEELTLFYFVNFSGCCRRHRQWVKSKAKVNKIITLMPAAKITSLGSVEICVEAVMTQYKPKAASHIIDNRNIPPRSVGGFFA